MTYPLASHGDHLQRVTCVDLKGLIEARALYTDTAVSQNSRITGELQIFIYIA